MNGNDSRHRQTVLVEWLLDRVGVPIAMWGRSPTGAAAVRFVDGARLELEVPAAATTTAVERLVSGTGLCIDSVGVSDGTISVGISGDRDLYEVATGAVVYDPATQRSGVRWVAPNGTSV